MRELTLTSFYVIVGLITIVGACLQAKRTIKEKRRKLSWTDVDSALGDLLENIRESGHNVDIIIGVAQGGAILSGFISHRMKYVPVFHVRRIELRKSTGERDGEGLDLCGDISANAKSILIVNGESSSGNTINSVKALLEKHNPFFSIKTAALFALDPKNSDDINVIYTPDFIGKRMYLKKKPPWRSMKNHGK